jgi:hypothetical protein
VILPGRKKIHLLAAAITATALIREMVQVTSATAAQATTAIHTFLMVMEDAKVCVASVHFEVLIDAYKHNEQFLKSQKNI